MRVAVSDKIRRQMIRIETNLVYRGLRFPVFWNPFLHGREHVWLKICGRLEFPAEAAVGKAF